MSLTIVDGLENFIELLKHDRKLVDSDLINMKNVLKTTKFNRNDLVNPTDNFNKLDSVIKRATLAVADFILNVEVSEKRLFIEIFELLLNNLPLTEFGPTVSNLIQLINSNVSLHETKMNHTKKELDSDILCISASIINVLLSERIKCDLNIFCDDKFHEVLITSAVSVINTSHNMLTLVSVFPKLSKLTNDYSVFKKFWSYILEQCVVDKCNIADAHVMKHVHSDACLSKKLSLLCSLGDYFIHNEKVSNSFLITDKNFWSVIYSGIINCNFLLRKQAMYLAKRAIDYLENVNSFSFETDYFVWDVNYSFELKNIWADVFIVLEVLEEKQLHLVMPVLPTVLKIFSFKVSSNGIEKKLLSDCWVSCICQRLFSHDSNLIIRWSLVNVLPSDHINWPKITIDYVTIIIKALNNSSLYSSQSNAGYSNVADSELGLSLHHWFVKMTHYDDTYRRDFFNKIIEVLSEITWGPIPLFFIVESLCRTPPAPCFHRKTLKILKYFVNETLRTQNIYIRGAIQCLIIRCIIRLTDIKEIDIKLVCDLLVTFKSDECLKRGTRSWCKTVKWLKMFINEDNAKMFLNNAVNSLVSGNTDFSIRGLARMTVMIYDTKIMQIDELNFNKFDDFSKVFKDCFMRPYVNINAFNNSLLYILKIFQESQSISENTCDVESMIPSNPALHVSVTHVNHIMLFIKHKLNTLSSISEIDSFKVYFDAIVTFTTSPHLVTLLEDSGVIIDIISDAYIILNDENESPVKKFYSIKIVSWYYEFIDAHTNFHNTSTTKNMMSNRLKTFVLSLLQNNRINEILPKTHSDVKEIIINSENIWKKLICDYIKGCWNLSYIYLKLSRDTSLYNIKNDISMDMFLNFGLEAVQIGGREIVLNVNKVFKIILPLVIKASDVNPDHVIRFISVSWESCFELRKLEIFWKVFLSWLEMVYQQVILKDDFYCPYLIKYINEIFDRSEYVSGLCNVLVSHLHKEIIEHAVLIRLHDVLIQSIIFGPVHRKDLRKENETCMYIKSHGCKYSVNTLKPMFNYQVDCEVRLKILDLIVKVYVINIYDLSEDVTASKNISENPLINIIKLLMKHDDIISSKKIRYFNDSLHHRIKNRILQALLLLQHVMITTFDSNLDNIKVLQKEIIDWVRSNLCKESQQPSVRYQLEWLLIRCILSNSDFINYFWDIFLQGSEERAGSVCSFISVAYHLAAVLKDTSFIKRCVQEVLPWSMAQQFNIRLYAQVTLAKLFELFADDELPIQYTIIKSSLTKSLKQGTAIKNVPKLMSDFYFSIFHPINHLSLKNQENKLHNMIQLQCKRNLYRGVTCQWTSALITLHRVIILILVTHHMKCTSTATMSTRVLV
ncbi:tRNA (guanosine(18)-2'-O)-methyltransferase TARBP1 isoform X2 [Lycorma delicatula]|uniref:tRNA (guanosine(18)-2'-O)-methyltransferase TARBP1 isoform X2 n=1 Tax=Lycorma delicatula TaxID=130591 RepID=UPI003F50E38A